MRQYVGATNVDGGEDMGTEYTTKLTVSQTRGEMRQYVGATNVDEGEDMGTEYAIKLTVR